MNQWHAMFLPLITLCAAGCYRGVEASPTTDSAEPSAEKGVSSETGQSLQAASGYKTPPRCGPRNCVAMCVTCFYDLCRAAGGTCSDCKQEMELCKDECGERECRPADPFCDFVTP
jgi:hypothetical protein